MRWMWPTIGAFCLGAWIYFGNYSGPAGLPLPALGEFVNPTTGFWRNSHPALTQKSNQSITSGGYVGEIAYCEREVPHIFADELLAVVYLQGYTTAHDRLWQMDLTTRAVEGRLAEILGERLLPRDRAQIREGYREAASRASANWAEHFPEEYALLEAYSQGVNDYLAQLQPKDYPIEFKLLEYAPEPWSPYRSALVVKSMAQSLSSRASDVAATYSRQQLGIDRFLDYYPERNPRQSPIISPSVVYDFEPVDTSEGKLPTATISEQGSLSSGLSHQKVWIDGHLSTLLDTAQAPDMRPMRPHPFNGSNNWAVAGSRSGTGLPILANDPHLSLTLPSIWYEIQLTVTDGPSCRGVSLPGLPLIVIGFNQDVAWGITNAGHDVKDWHQISWVDEQHERYYFEGDVLNVSYRYDTIAVKGAEPLIEKTPWTVWGPIVDTAANSQYAWLAMHSLAHETATDRPHGEFGVFRKLLESRSLEEMEAALVGFQDPSSNFVLSSREGDIAMRPSGAFPLRAPGQGKFVLGGDRADYGWAGQIPPEHRPAQVNPRRGFVSSANQRTTAADYPYYYLGGFDDYRGRYLNRKLAQGESFNQRAMKELQQDAYSLLAEELLPLLLARVDRDNLDAEQRNILQLLGDWDYTYRTQSQAPAFFNRWRDRAYRLTVDEIPRDSGYLSIEYWRWIEWLRSEPEHPIFDIQETETRETAARITQRAFDEVLEEWADSQTNWGEERNTRIPHLGRIPGMGSGLITSSGSPYSLNSIKSGHGPSWRMVVEMGSPPEAWGVIPGGSSGNPGSPHYDDGLKEWAAGRYYQLPLRERSTSEGIKARWIFATDN
ncbi:MAG: penicillin acylase family protein [Bacteroidota bacterium]